MKWHTETGRSLKMECSLLSRVAVSVRVNFEDPGFRNSWQSRLDTKVKSRSSSHLMKVGLVRLKNTYGIQFAFTCRHVCMATTSEFFTWDHEGFLCNCDLDVRYSEPKEKIVVQNDKQKRFYPILLTLS